VKRLRVILRNLISNSFKYQNPAENHPYIRISIIIETDRALIEIEDNGMGIHPQHFGKIYDMFFRGTDHSSGSGLGLYIVKSMVEKLSGEITFTSFPEKGSLFKVGIPNKRASLFLQSGNALRPYSSFGLAHAKDITVPPSRIAK
jgi:signal transduction histidine kinase